MPEYAAGLWLLLCGASAIAAHYLDPARRRR